MASHSVCMVSCRIGALIPWYVLAWEGGSTVICLEPQLVGVAVGSVSTTCCLFHQRTNCTDVSAGKATSRDCHSYILCRS
jgi:hypothetical protein